MGDRYTTADTDSRARAVASQWMRAALTTVFQEEEETRGRRGTIGTAKGASRLAPPVHVGV